MLKYYACGAFLLELLVRKELKSYTHEWFVIHFPLSVAHSPLIVLLYFSPQGQYFNICVKGYSLRQSKRAYNISCE